MSKSKYTSLVKTLVNLAWPTSASRCLKATPLLYYLTNNHQNGTSKPDEKLNKYWPTNKTVEEILKDADKLYREKKYMEVYEMLNRLKYNNNSDVKWRIARVLYQTTSDNALPADMEKDIIAEAYDLLIEEATDGNGNPNIHKWFAIICDCHNKLKGLEKRIQGYHTVLKHLRMAYNLNPDDITVCYLLGKLCFDMAELHGMKRLMAKIFYADPPNCTFEEAHKYLCRLEELSERRYLTNVYLLGRTCYELKQFYKAKYYLHMACCMKPHSDIEKKQVHKAKQFLVKLEKFKLGRGVLFLECECPVKQEKVPICEDDQETVSNEQKNHEASVEDQTACCDECQKKNYPEPICT